MGEHQGEYLFHLTNLEMSLFLIVRLYWTNVNTDLGYVQYIVAFFTKLGHAHLPNIFPIKPAHSVILMILATQKVISF